MKNLKKSLNILKTGDLPQLLQLVYETRGSYLSNGICGLYGKSPV